MPVLIGAIPLMYVQSLTISEGYKIERIANSHFSQALAPTAKTIAIEATLMGRERLLLRKGLEAMAMASRALVAAAAPLFGITGIPVISGLTISLDMQITDLKFSHSVSKRDALDASITLRHVPRSAALIIASEVADLALAVATVALPTGPEPNPIPRT